MGILDVFNTAEGQQALGLLAAAGPRSDGAGTFQRLQEGLGAADQWKMRQAKMQQEERQAKMQQMQMQQAEAQMAQQQKIQDLAKQFNRPGSAAISPLAGNAETGIMPSAGRAAVPGGFDYEGFANAVAEFDPFKAQEIRKSMVKQGPEFSTAPQYDQNGRAFVIAKDGSMKYLGDVKARDKLEEVRLGSKVGLRNPYSAEIVGSLPIEQSPDSKASNAIGWANNALARQKFAFDQTGGVDSGGVAQTGLNKQFGKPQAGYRWKADGSMEFIPGGPADQKAQMKTSGEGTVDSVVADLRDKYQKLNEGGGIVNDQSGALGNIGARMASSGIGQTLGGAVGTTNQTSRDNIAMTRPLLLQAIMKATGMSAKQMDSNAELKLYLATATDPTKGYQANMDALQRIEELYGSGQKSGARAADTPIDKPADSTKLIDFLPTANASNKGKKYRDTTTGKILVSNGMSWKEVP